jgi:uncharacterized protein YciI
VPFALEVATVNYLLIYDVVDDYLERRAPHRDEHLKLAQEFVTRGALQLGGPLADPIDQAVLLFQAEDPSTVEEFVARDPYRRNGVVRSYRIRPWTIVVDSLGAKG